MAAFGLSVRPVTDFRSLWGGIAYIITGVLVTLIAGMYFLSDPASNPLQSRILWEVVLNLQILSLALIWFSFESRFERRQGSSKLRTLLEFVFALTGNAVPTLIFLHFTYYASEHSYPPLDQVIAVCRDMTVLFFLFDLAMRFRVRSRKIKNNEPVPETGAEMWKAFFLATWQGWLCMGLLVCAAITDHTWYYVLIPFLGYWQGAKEYFDRALKPDRPIVT